MERKSINWRTIGFPLTMRKSFRFFDLILILVCASFFLSACGSGGSGGGNGGGNGGGGNITDIPDALVLMLGRGYDVTGRYAASSEIKNPVLDLNKLTQARYVKRDPNYRNASYESISGSTIQAYQNSLATKVSTSASAGVEGVGSFSAEVGASFGMERATNSEYSFATSTSRIVRDAYVIDYRNDPSKLLPYVSEQFKTDAQTMTPEQLVVKYGTHVMLGGVLGARLDYHMSAKAKQDSSAHSIGAYASARAEASIEGINVGGGGSAEVDTQFSDYFYQTSVNTETTVVGGDPEQAQLVHVKGYYDDWVHSIAGNEVWSDYYPESLVPISEFITDTAKKQAVETYYQAYFESKKIIVTTDTHKDIVAAEGVLLKGIATNESTGDSDIASHDGSYTDWELIVEPKRTIDGRNIDVDFTYTVTERGGDGTKLVLRQTQKFTVNKNIISIDSPNFWRITGTAVGDQSNKNSWVILNDKVVATGDKSPILSWTAIKVDGDGEDQHNIAVRTHIKVKYTYQD